MPAAKHPADVAGQPITELIAFRCSKPMASGLARHALIEGTDRSVLIRQLIREGAERHGINITTI